MKFDQDAFRSHVRLSMARCRLVHNKLLAASRAARSSIADLLQADRLDSARIKTRLVIRDDYLAEAVEQLECYLDDLLHGATLIAHCAGPSIDDTIQPAVQAVLYAQPRVQVPELAMVRDDLQCKLGRHFCQQAVNNVGNVVDGKFCLKLAMRLPDEALVERYLETIAESAGIVLSRRPTSPPAYSDIGHVDFTVPVVAPPLPPSSSSAATATVGFEEIAKRFEQLKRRP